MTSVFAAAGPDTAGSPPASPASPAAPTPGHPGWVRRPAAPLHVPARPVRFVTAASLFDGHDAAINIMRRLLQAQGAEVIHLGHNRSVDEVVTAAVQEDAQGIAVSSYQGGHVEYFKYLIDRLRAEGRPGIRVYGGGGGTIIPAEIAELQAYGVARIFSPQDGQSLGLGGHGQHPHRRVRPPCCQRWQPVISTAFCAGDQRVLARALTAAEDGEPRGAGAPGDSHRRGGQPGAGTRHHRNGRFGQIVSDRRDRAQVPA